MQPTQANRSICRTLHVHVTKNPRFVTCEMSRTNHHFSLFIQLQSDICFEFGIAVESIWRNTMIFDMIIPRAPVKQDRCATFV